MRISKTQKLTNDIKFLKERINAVSDDVTRYEKIIDQIKDLLKTESRYANITILAKDIPMEVMKLVIYKQSHEGAYRPFQLENENYKDIIRWLISPEAANNSKELENLKKQFNV